MNGAYTRGYCDFVVEFVLDTFHSVGKEVDISIEPEWAIAGGIEFKGQFLDEDPEEDPEEDLEES